MPEIQLTQLERIKERLRCIELLKLIKKRMTYEELSEITDLPVTVLNRYVRGHVLPSTERSENLIAILENEIDLAEEVRRRLKFDKLGYFDNTALLGDTLLLRNIARFVAQKFAKDGVTKILTAVVDGVPMGAHVANELEVDLVMAKKDREVGVQEFVEETYIPSYSGVRMTLYVPKDRISKKDRVLVVDDIIRSGETQRALINLVKETGADVVGLVFLVAIGDAWREEIILSKGKIETILNLPSNR